MNNKVLCVVLVISGLILSAVIMINGRLLLLAIPFLAYLMIGIFQSPSEVVLLAHRAIDKLNAVPEEPIETHIIIENQGKHTIKKK